MPGNRPPSAIPRMARTAKKLPKFLTKPRHMVMIPHIAVKRGSQIFGVIFLRTRLEGSSLLMIEDISSIRILDTFVTFDELALKG